MTNEFCAQAQPCFAACRANACYRGLTRLCRVSNNTVIERREEPAMITAIHVTGESRDNLVQHNQLQAGTAGAVVCDEGQVVVLNNTVVAG